MHLRSADIAPHRERESGPTVTADFAATWPAVEAPLRRYLTSMGVNGHDIDDLVQETASRALASTVPYASANDLRAWAFVVARNLLTDLYRARRRHVTFDAPRHADLAQDDLMRQVEDRLFLATVVASAASLTEDERRHLVATTSGTARERNRAAVARHRARQHLRKLVGPLVAVAVLVRRRPTLGAASIGIVAAAIPLALLPSAGHGRSGDKPASQHVEARPAAVGSIIRESARPAVRAKSRSRSVIVVRPEATSALPASETSLHATGPAGSNAHASLQDNDGKQPLVCITGPVIGQRCVDVPTGIGGRNH